MDNHRAAWWCWLRHLIPGEQVDVFHIDRHTDTLTSNLQLWMKNLPSQMRGKSLVDYLGYQATVNGFAGPVIRWDNYLSLFFEYEKARLRNVYFATHGDGGPPNLAAGTWWNVSLCNLPANFDIWLA